MMSVTLGTRAVETAVTSLAPFLAMPSFSYFLPTWEGFGLVRCGLVWCGGWVWFGLVVGWVGWWVRVWWWWSGGGSEPTALSQSLCLSVYIYLYGERTMKPVMFWRKTRGTPRWEQSSMKCAACGVCFWRVLRSCCVLVGVLGW